MRSTTLTVYVCSLVPQWISPLTDNLVVLTYIKPLRHLSAAATILATGACQIFGRSLANLHGTKVKYKNKQIIRVNKIYHP